MGERCGRRLACELVAQQRLRERAARRAEAVHAGDPQGGDALAAISVDGALGPEVCAALLELPDVRSATVVRFRDGEHA